MTTTINLDVKIDFFLKTHLTIEQLSTRKKYDMKEASHITSIFFQKFKNINKRSLVPNLFQS